MASTTYTIQDGDRTAIMRFTHDSGAEAAVNKVIVANLNASARGQACTGVKISKIDFMTEANGIELYWEATVPVLAAALPKDYADQLDFASFGGLFNNAAAAGKTGNISFTTAGATKYVVVLHLIKSYGAQ